MIVRDEEEYILSAIESVSAIAGEVIVLDTGSSDCTIDLAIATGAQVYQAEWNDDFSSMRNKCIQYATKPYILMIDADEVLIDFDKQSFNSYISINNLRDAAARVKVVNITDQGDVSSFITRLFPNRSNYRYEGRIHEQLTYDDEPAPAIDLNITLQHKGYLPSALYKKDKTTRNLQLLLKEKEVSNSTYINYHLGRTYYLDKQYEESIPYLQRVIASTGSEAKNVRYVSGAYSALGYSYIKLKQWDHFIKLFIDSIEKYPDYTDLYFMYGTALIESRNLSWFKEIPSAFQHCLILGEADPALYETNAGVGSFKAYYNLGLYYELTGSVEEAIRHYEASSSQGYSPATDRCKRLYT